MENMNKAKYIFVLSCAFVAFIIGAQGCKKENLCDCVKGTGEIISETRITDPFTEIFVEGRINIILSEDTTLSQEVTVEAGEKLIGLIRTEVVGGVLRIRNDNRCDFMRRYDIPVNIYIRVSNNITRITNKGTALITNTDTCTASYISLETISTGDIKMTMNAGSVYTQQHGNGDVEVYGNAHEVIVYNTGNGFTIADQCAAGYCWVSTRTTGKITLYPTGLLISEIGGPGNVYYRGTPSQIISTENSAGKLLPLQ
jgi:hypothetical protein